MDEGTKFRRALKNPVVMVGLCILAGAAVYDSIIESTVDSSLPSSGALIESPVPVALAPTTLAPSRTGHDKEATRWVHNPTRDPFSPVLVTKRSNQSPSQTAASGAHRPQNPHGVSPERLTLKAIAIESQHRSAVINHHVVYEGEMIEGYRVVSIQPQGVWLKRHGRKQFLTFDTNATS